MGLNQTPSANRVHIGFFGRRNAGKSSLVNAVTGQNLAVVSDVRGTTTDPVYKAMELLPVGPVVIIDTPGIDDEGALGALRVRRARQVLNKTDVAVLVVDAAEGRLAEDDALIRLFEEKKIPFIIAYNKTDIDGTNAPAHENSIAVSATAGQHIEALKERIAALAQTEAPSHPLVRDLLDPGDLVVLVVPIDKAAPKGRLILPQQQTIRDVLEAGAASVVVRDTELAQTLTRLGQPPRLVVTDSQAFGPVSKIVPSTVPLTSFSILFARYKGLLHQAVHGAAMLDALTDGDRVLIAEGCTHHRQCEDIGTVKLPGWINKHTQGKDIEFSFTSGTEFPDDVSSCRLVIHCGGCMLNEREMRYRAQCAADQGVPFTNYGIAIAHMHGILRRSIAPFPDMPPLRDIKP